MQQRTERYEPRAAVIVLRILEQSCTYRKFCYFGCVIHAVFALHTSYVALVFRAQLYLVCNVCTDRALEVKQHLRYQENTYAPFSEFSCSAFYGSITLLAAVFGQ